MYAVMCSCDGTVSTCARARVAKRGVRNSINYVEDCANIREQERVRHKTHIVDYTRLRLYQYTDVECRYVCTYVRSPNRARCNNVVLIVYGKAARMCERARVCVEQMQPCGTDSQAVDVVVVSPVATQRYVAYGACNACTQKEVCAAVWMRARCGMCASRRSAIWLDQHSVVSCVKCIRVIRASV